MLDEEAESPFELPFDDERRNEPNCGIFEVDSKRVSDVMYAVKWCVLHGLCVGGWVCEWVNS